MQRITISLDDDLLDLVDALASRRRYASRSEALRDIIRDGLSRQQPDVGEDERLATLSYVFDHEKRDLARRLVTAQHHSHALSVATLHVHLDHHNCLEVSVLKGKAGDLQAFADEVTSQRGVTHGNLHLLPMPEDHEH